MGLWGMLTFPVYGAFDNTYWHLVSYALTKIASSATAERVRIYERACALTLTSANEPQLATSATLHAPS